MRDRVAIVTGAGRGIGRATALALARDGARVLGVSRTASELEALAAEAHVEVLVESVATEAGRLRIVEEARRRLGPIEILVPNAGVGSTGEEPAWGASLERWREALELNLEAPFDLIRLALPDMIARGWGRIVVVASLAADSPGPGMPAYAASKAGVVGLVRSVARDSGGHGVTCNAVLPGRVRTAMAEQKTREEAAARGVSVDRIWAERAAAAPAGRLVTAEEVAETIAFLASDRASGISGEALRVALGER